MAVFRRCRSVVLAAAVIVAGCAVNTDSGRQPGSAPPKPGTTTAPPVVPPHQPPVAVPVPAPAFGGTYSERLENALRQPLSPVPAIRVQRNGDTVKVTVPGSLAFAANSDQIQPRFVASLDAVATVLREYVKTSVEIRGYTDSTGSFEHNQQLSERRAQSLGSYLTARQVAAPRIRTAGYGPRYPVADNKTDAGRAQNRRIEIELVPLP